MIAIVIINCLNILFGTTYFNLVELEVSLLLHLPT